GDVVLKGGVGQRAEAGAWVLHISGAVVANTDTFTLFKRSRLRTIQRVQEELNVSERGRQTGILTASIPHADGQLAARILNAITQEYMLQNIRRNAAEAENSLQFLQEQVPTIQQNLRDAEDEL